MDQSVPFLSYVVHPEIKPAMIFDLENSKRKKHAYIGPTISNPSSPSLIYDVN